MKSKLQSKKHSELSASSTERWWNCPGSVEMIRNSPKPKTTWYSAEGTAAHEVAQCILTNKPYKKQYIVGPDGNIVADRCADSHVIDVSEEMLEAVDVYVEYVKELMRKHKLKSHHLMVEIEVELPGHDQDGSRRKGTADTILHVPMTCLYVIDYKHGQGTPVAIDDNLQLLNYMWGAFYKLTEEEREDIQFIYGVIVQPRGRGNGISMMMKTPDELSKFHDECISRIARTKMPDAELYANRKWCKFCPAKFNEETGQYCPEHKALSHIDATVDFEDVTTLDTPEQMTPERLAKVLNGEKAALDWFAKCKELAHNWIYKQNKTIPGFTKGFARSSREWKIKNELELSKELRTIFNPAEILTPSTLKSLTDLEKILKAKRTQAKKEKQPLDEIEEKLVKFNSLIQSVEGKEKVVPDKGGVDDEFEDM